MKNTKMDEPQSFVITQMESVINRKFRPLIACGGTLVILSGALIVFSIAFFDVIGYNYIFGFDLATSFFHVKLGFIAMIGGFNREKFHRLIIASLVLTIIGCVLFVVPVLIINVNTWYFIARICNEDCKELVLNQFVQPDRYCNSCDSNQTIAYLTILITVIFIGVTDIMISSLACYNLCSCCRKPLPLYSYEPQNFPNLPYQPLQLQIPSNYPSNYTLPEYAIGPNTAQSQENENLPPEYDDGDDHQIQYEDRAPIMLSNDKF